MIKVSGTKKRIRETTAPYIHEEKGKEITSDIRVLYYGRTWGEMEAEHSELSAIAKNDPNTPIWPHHMLAKRLHALPDLADAKGGEFKITNANLGQLDPRNLAAIKKAIDEDIAGK